ncbi:uncharacterized protein F4812DRAFT_423426 [Daldinia caldariorum]|uniref:uncharacterized protein n=1 Tax=Daldinia caldariorum TaxID=326644 RepID=UPI0020083DE9|nr:uncharacterized protein F4812DRAFT_423426 [Daldinia caldariorum]KAI1469514.1 hypothetical protein F4812DRAFT_423426 [Daldinia caldariorum]
MNKTKETIRDFIGKSGHHDTTVHESVQPAVKKETIKPTEHEEINTAVDKEIHQDHYHRTVQPVHDKEVLPEQHQHKVGTVQHRDYDHRDHESTKRALAAENERFRDEQVIQGTTHTREHAPTVQGEHIHHHVHETIQPVLHKETIQPSVVHTTVPIHETHHNPAQHHSTTSLPPISAEEYRQHGGALDGQKERFDSFEGEPRSIRGTIETMHEEGRGLKNPPDGVFHGDFNPLDGGRDHHFKGSAGGATATGAGTGVGASTGSNTGTSQGMSSQSAAQREYRDGARRTSGTSGVSGTRKENPSLLNKLNPLTDSNGDGKAGFMK